MKPSGCSFLHGVTLPNVGIRHASFLAKWTTFPFGGVINKLTTRSGQSEHVERLFFAELRLLPNAPILVSSIDCWALVLGPACVCSENEQLYSSDLYVLGAGSRSAPPLPPMLEWA